MSVLTNHFNTKYNTAPFSKIKNADFIPAFQRGIELAKNEIDAIIRNPLKPTFENTIEALAFSGAVLDRISSIFFNLNSAETSDEMQKIAQEVSPLLSEFGNDVRLNGDLFARVKAVYEKRDKLKLNTEQTRLLDKKYKSFSRNGANLSDNKKVLLREIDKELSKLSLQFGENVLAETQAFKLHITNENDLAGLPEGTLEAARSLAKNLEKDGWIFTLDHPSYLPFVTYADNRELRKKMAIAFGARAFQNNEFDNQEIVLKIAKLRFDRAQVLGYATHAHFVLEERMAETPEKVISFSNDLLAKAKPAAEREFAQLTAFAKKLDGIDQLEKWDGAYYSEKLKQQLFRLDDEILKPYFQLEKVLDGAFAVAQKLYGITFEEIIEIDKYHQDVKTFEVKDEDDELVAIFFQEKGNATGLG
jgi:Zn-dependent oligopeptidase